MKVLIIGSGGREHCLAWKISQSPLVDRVYCAPGNGGTSLIAQNVDISALDINGLVRFAEAKKIDLTVVGPEIPLVEGIVDIFQDKGLAIFGPRKELALLEGSKAFAKRTMRKYGIPTSDFKVFSDPEEAKKYIKSRNVPLVVKADGLAAGKGVIVCESVDQAYGAVDLIMVDRVFKSAGENVIIEDFAQGDEVSILAFSDGVSIVPLVTSQDYKRALDVDKGLNTGGMGAYSPAPLVDKECFQSIINKVFVPLIDGLKKEGKIYTGILYAGLMIKDNEPCVLEFNVRFGDPETQVILPKLNSDLVEVMLKTINGKLDSVELEWNADSSICVVLASQGYPGSYQKGREIHGLSSFSLEAETLIFHAGTKSIQDIGSDRHRFVTDGGRVLNVVALGKTLKDAQDKVYQDIDRVRFEGMFYRRDIGNKVLSKNF